jgi:hypothetical protein
VAGVQVGGSTSAIVLNPPGEGSGAATAIDGRRMAPAGRAGPATGVAAMPARVASAIAGGELGLEGYPLRPDRVRRCSPPASEVAVTSRSQDLDHPKDQWRDTVQNVEGSRG